MWDKLHKMHNLIWFPWNPEEPNHCDGGHFRRVVHIVQIRGLVDATSRLWYTKSWGYPPTILTPP
jgi:hypothetical protein